MLDVFLSTQLNTFGLDMRFSVASGTTTVLLGESGAGKSTVLRLLAGLLQPRVGHISLDGIVYLDSERRIALSPQDRPIGYVFQEYLLFPHLSVFENVAFGLRAQHLARPIVRERVSEALSRVHLSGFEKRQPHQLSGGQQQRVALARALALRPSLLLLDEPLAALDVQTRREVRQELRSILAETGITTVLVTHHYIDALVFGQHILVLDQGRVIQQGGQSDLALHPRSTYVAELVGMNFFHACLMRYAPDGSCIVELSQTQPTLEMTVRFEEGENGSEVLPAGTDVCVVIDPRDITLQFTPPESSARNSYQGRIVQILNLPSASGGLVRVSIALDGVSLPPLTAEITGTSAARLAFEEGQLVYASFKASATHAYL
ncbi:ABC transporter ATP-binding protein [Ktedonospora formicarum]|nr:ABC transporter ATP-binding protein [Ktedonospora formicarum]